MQGKKSRRHHISWVRPINGRKSKRRKKKESNPMRTIRTILATALASLALAGTSFAGSPVNVAGASGIALDGYDPVAFFTEQKPLHGDPAITGKHQGATYLFANEEHRNAFVRNPDKYVPQFGGYCAYGVSVGALFPVDIDTWQVRNGKLYLNLNPEILKVFNGDFEGNVSKADKNWPDLVRKQVR
jgi:hypothetical protein